MIGENFLFFSSALMLKMQLDFPRSMVRENFGIYSSPFAKNVLKLSTKVPFPSFICILYITEYKKDSNIFLVMQRF